MTKRLEDLSQYDENDRNRIVFFGTGKFLKKIHYYAWTSIIEKEGAAKSSRSLVLQFYLLARSTFRNEVGNFIHIIPPIMLLEVWIHFTIEDVQIKCFNVTLP